MLEQMAFPACTTGGLNPNVFPPMGFEAPRYIGQEEGRGSMSNSAPVNYLGSARPMSRPYIFKPFKGLVACLPARVLCVL